MRKPSLGKLTFVQIDEFYPISPAQHNSRLQFKGSKLSW